MNIIGEFLGYLAGTCLAISFLPQAIKIIKNKDVSSISLVTYIIYNIGSISWILYGIYLKSFQMILFNTITSIFTLTILFMTIKYNLTKKNK